MASVRWKIKTPRECGKDKTPVVQGKVFSQIREMPVSLPDGTLLGANMYDELTEVDIRKMEEEIEYRKVKLAPELGAELKRTREYGDLSENAEYKEAKRAKRKNEGRIRYLENMIRTAKVIEIKKADDEVGLFDRVLIFNEKMGAEKEIQIVTTLRQNALLGFVSKESPLGSAIMGHKAGDRVLVRVSETMSYYVQIRRITKGEDNEELPISGF